MPATLTVEDFQRMRDSIAFGKESSAVFISVRITDLEQLIDFAEKGWMIQSLHEIVNGWTVKHLT